MCTNHTLIGSTSTQIRAALLVAAVYTLLSLTHAAHLFGPRLFHLGGAKLGHFGPWGYGHIGDARIGRIGNLHYGQIGGLYGNSFVGAANPYAADDATLTSDGMMARSNPYPIDAPAFQATYPGQLADGGAAVGAAYPGAPEPSWYAASDVDSNTNWVHPMAYAAPLLTQQNPNEMWMDQV